MSPLVNPAIGTAVQSRRALLAERLRQAAGTTGQRPLSFAQQRLWFLDQLEPNSPLYNIATVARLTGKLDLAALEEAFNAVVARHEALRTRFLCPDETPLQVGDGPKTLKVRVVDLQNCPERDREHEAKRLTREEINRPFNLGQEQLLRVTLLRLAPGESRLILILHHIIADEWSLKVLFNELAAFYRGLIERQPVRLPELPIQYADFAVWQRDWLQGELLEEQLSYWKQHLGGSPPVTELFPDRPRRSTPTFAGGNASRLLGPTLQKQLQELAHEHNATLFMVLLAGFKALLYRYTQQEDLVVGSPIAGRTRVETEGLIGFFVNTLPLRTRVEGQFTFLELLRRVQEVTLAGFAHQHVPFERLVEELQPERSLDHNPFTRLMFVVQNDLLEKLELPGLQVEFLEAESDLSKFDLTLVVQETSRGLMARVEYNRDLFDRGTLERLLEHYEVLLHGIAAAPEQRVSELPLLTESEREQLLVQWNATATDYPRHKTIHELFEAQARRTPNAAAVVFGNRKLTYGELNARANQLAGYLRKCGVGPDVPVGICVARSPEMVLGLLAILKAGGAYVPLDSAYPAERLAFMLQDTQTPVLLTQQELLTRLPVGPAQRLCLDSDWNLVAHESSENLPSISSPESLAYIMYTSGSTGVPKGVAVPHRAVVRLVRDTNYIQLDETDRIGQVSNVSFDAATFELWGALLNGGQLVGISRDVALSPADFARELREQKITAMFLTAALFNQLAAEVPGALETLRTAMAGGEALDPNWVRAVLRNRPPQRLVNGYGPTENTTFTCCYWIRDLSDEAANVPIGRPIANTQVYILDRHLSPVPIGVPGELYAGGDGLARGYWNRPELTAEKFVPNPFSPPGQRQWLYKTGDLARYLPDGNIEFLGRLDQQVKIRGFRIELGEIETILGQHAGVRECVVTVYGNGSGTRRLAAYLVPEANGTLNASELREFLNQKLPDYMVPAFFVPLPALPLTPNGKVDRKALPAPDQGRPALERKYAAPQNEVERRLVGIWEQVLAVQPVGVEDKFFDLGGHSLLAVKLVAQIQKAFGRKLRLATIFQAPTVSQLAAILRGEVKERSLTTGTSVVELQGQGTRPPFYFVHGAGGGMFWGYANLSRCLGKQQPVYVFKSRGMDGREEFTRLEEMAAQYVADLRLVQPQGPYYLGGYCFGGNVAYEMARQLVAQGHEVAFLALFNCAPPNSRYFRIPWTPLWVGRLVRNLFAWAGLFHRWNAQQRREFLRSRRSALKRLVLRFRSGFGNLSDVQAGDLVDMSSFTDEQQRLWATHIQALLDFHPQTYSGQVHLFRSAVHPLWCSFDPDYGWKDLAQGGVATTIVPGAHEEILEEPWVEVLSRALTQALPTSQGGGDREPAAPPELRGWRRWLKAAIERGARAFHLLSHCLSAGALPGNTGTLGAISGPKTASRTEPVRQADVAPNGLSREPGLGPQMQFPADTTYAQQFVFQAERTPNAVAVRCKGESLTYAELNTRANQLAHQLQSLGVGPEVLVGICLGRSLDLMVALLGVLKAGGAYVPLDPAYPQERLACMVTDSKLRVLLTEPNLQGRISGFQGTTLLATGRWTVAKSATPGGNGAPENAGGARNWPASNPPCAATADNLAYVIYTSGSTGLPKGVQITHRALLNHNFAIRQAFQLSPADRVLQFTPLSFDISVEEIFPSWLAGATVVLRTDEVISTSAKFLDFVAEEKLTVLNLPTAYWQEFTDYLYSGTKPLAASVRLVVVGGEKASVEVCRRWQQCVSQAVKLLNGYGVTEAAVTSTLYEARPGAETFPIGKPIANTQVVILDEKLQPVPDGTPGELFIGGAGLGRGYLNQPELTARQFIPNPWPEKVPSERLYRTGDQARFLPDGHLEFIGRVDEQVKIRGYRIELGEIEAALLQHPAIQETVAVLREDSPGRKRLVAYYTPRAAASLRVHELIDFLKGKVPEYLVPSAFVALQPLPRTPAGKIDRRALPAPDKGRPELDEQFVPARSPMEETLAHLWTEVLEVSPVGVNDNFFELGGHSLLALQIISRIRERFKVEVSLEEFFGAPTVAGLAHLFAGREVLLPQILDLPAGEPGRPLRGRQRRLWFLEEFNPGQCAYSQLMSLQVLGELDFIALRQSLLELAQRHPALRAVFPAEAGQPVQHICPASVIQLPLVDLSEQPEKERASLARQFIAKEARRDCLQTQPLLRPLLLRLSRTEHWLALILHEVAADARSLRLLYEDLAALYGALVAGKQSPLPPLAVSYPEVGAGEIPFEPEEEARELEYWRQQLQGIPHVLEIPSDRPRRPRRSEEGACQPVILSPSVQQALEALSKAAGCTLFDALLAGWATLLHRYTGISDIVIGSQLSCRSGAERERVVGNFENPVALRCDVSGDPTFRELLGRIGTTTANARAHSRLLFATLVEELHLERNVSHSPVFQVEFVLEEEPWPERNAAGVTFKPFHIDKKTSKTDLLLHLTRTAEGLTGWVEYCTDIFNASRLQRLVDHFQTLVEAAVKVPEQHLSALPLLAGEETQRLLVEWNDAAQAYPAEKTLVQLFAEQVERTPEADALVDGQTRLSYRELQARAGRLAERLQSLGVERESRVGICLERGWEMLAAILGTLQAGGAYVPLDPAYPKERLAFIAQDAGLCVLLTQQSLRGALAQTNVPMLCVEDVEWSAAQNGPGLKRPQLQANDLAYIIYTSGSTGQPKGVMVEHRSVVAFVHWARQVFSADELNGVLVATSVCFDVSVFEMFVPLCWGGKLVLAANILALPALPAAGEVKLVAAVPSALRELLRLKAIPPSVRVACLAGEPLSASLADQLYRESPVQKVYDLYGPTEATVYATFALRKPGEPATIGRPLANVQAYVLDPHLRPAPIGIPGELYLGGHGLARGYWQRPELTAERFVPHPFQAGGRLYKTGDLVRWREDGNLEFLGRLDQQLKIRGFRIEPGEIETVLKAHPGVREALVLARDDGSGDRRLVAYVAMASEQGRESAELRRLARERLPEYMVPAAFVFLDALPLLPNGKVNRRALPQPEQERAQSPVALVAPRNPVEEQLVNIWREVLHAEQVGVNDNFFELGGHSLLAVQVIGRIRDVFGAELPLFSLFDAPTVALVAEGLASGRWTQNRPALLPLKPVPRKGELPVSFVQERLWFLDQLEPGSPAYNLPLALRLQGPLAVEALQQAFQELLRRHEALRTTFQYAEGRLAQLIRPEAEGRIQLAELSGLTAENRQRRIQEFINAEARKPFDLVHGPLIRALLVRVEPAPPVTVAGEAAGGWSARFQSGTAPKVLAEPARLESGPPSEHLLLVVMHHSISDGWSLAVFFRELEAYYNAFAAEQSAPELAPLPVQYADFAAWQRQTMQGRLLEQEMAYWKEKLAGAPAAMDLPTDREEPKEPSGKAARCSVLLADSVFQAMTEESHRSGCTPFMLLMAALVITLHKWTEQKDLVVGTVVAGRNRRELENVLGCFMNFLPIRTRVTGAETGQELLAQVRTAVLEGQTHQDCPFEKMVEALNPKRQLNQNPLYNVGLLWQNFPADLFRAAGLAVEPLPVSREAARLDLCFEAEQTRQGFSLACEYKADLFVASTIEQLLASYCQTIELLVRQPSLRLSDYQLSAALATQAKAARRSKERQTLAIAATFTAEPLAESLQYWMGELELAVDLKFAPYNQVFQQLLDPASLLSTNARGLNVLCLRLEDWEESGAVPAQAEQTAWEENIRRHAQEFVGAVKTAAARHSAPCLVCLCPPSDVVIADPARSQVLAGIEQGLFTGLQAVSGVFVLTAQELVRWYPVAEYFDRSGNELGHVPFTPLFYTALGTAVARKFHALNCPAAKVIVLDCDQALWSGVCGEDGAQGVRLDPPYLALQQFLCAQREAGRLLCLCSKNNAADVLEVFAKRPEMPLRFEHFSACRLNWRPKAENLKSLAQELQIGLDSFVFLDDNPLECAEVEARCPEVLTLQLPEDPALIPQFLQHAWVFDQLKLTVQPSATKPPPEARAVNSSPANGGGAVRKVARCRAIALETNAAEKIHRKLQARFVSQAERKAAYVSPRTPLESQLAELWQRVLRQPVVGVRDNFFDLGGQSLLAVRLVAEVEELTGRKLPLVTLFRAPTVEELARVLTEANGPSATELLVPIQPQGTKPPLFLVHGAGGDVLWGYANLAACLPSDQPVYGIRSRAQIGLEEHSNLEEMARGYLQALREFQPCGPYYLGGYGFGGNVAYEMARQLRAQGQAVALLALLDASPANIGYEKPTWWQPAFPFRFGRNVYYWLADHAALSNSERRSLLAGKARTFSRQLRRRLGRQQGLMPVGLETRIDPALLPEKELEIWRLHLLALEHHVEQPYAGKVTLLRTRGQAWFCSLQHDFGWSKVAGGGVEVRLIPGAHENIFLDPQVKHLAQQLTLLLAEAHQGDSGK